MSNIDLGGGRVIFTVDRIVALTDGVFAIAMTLLVLNLSIPVIAPHMVQVDLPHRLLELWPKLLGYLISFIALGVCWLMHHRIFHYIQYADNTLLFLNIFFLMFIALVPFSTSLLTDYGEAQITFAVYGINLSALFILRYFMWDYAARKNHLIASDINPVLVKKLKFMPLPSSILILLAVGISFINVWAAAAILLLLLVWGMLVSRIWRIP